MNIRFDHPIFQKRGFMKTYQFSGQSAHGAFQFDVNVLDEATQEDVADEIEEVLDAEDIVPQGGIVVRRVTSSSWGEFEE